MYRCQEVEQGERTYVKHQNDKLHGSWRDEAEQRENCWSHTQALGKTWFSHSWSGGLDLALVKLYIPLSV